MGAGARKVSLAVLGDLWGFPQPLPVHIRNIRTIYTKLRAVCIYIYKSVVYTCVCVFVCGSSRIERYTQACTCMHVYMYYTNMWLHIYGMEGILQTQEPLGTGVRTIGPNTLNLPKYENLFFL